MADECCVAYCYHHHQRHHIIAAAVADERHWWPHSVAAGCDVCNGAFCLAGNCYGLVRAALVKVVSS